MGSTLVKVLMEQFTDRTDLLCIVQTWKELEGVTPNYSSGSLPYRTVGIGERSMVIFTP